MKKFLTIMVELILLLSMSSCSSILKRKEAEYKAKVKQELDSIPIEETGYKLIETDGADINAITDDNKLLINGYKYSFVYHEFNNSFVIKVDNESCSDKKISLLTYGDILKKYKIFYGCCYFNNQIFLILYQYTSMWGYIDYKSCLPPVLFLYNYEENTIKYCGYFEEWFNYSPSKAKSKRLKIIKL